MANGITFHALHSLVCIDGFLNDVILLVHFIIVPFFEFSERLWIRFLRLTFFDRVRLVAPDSYQARY